MTDTTVEHYRLGTLKIGKVLDTEPTPCADRARWDGKPFEALVEPEPNATLTISEVVRYPHLQALHCDGCDATWTETRR